MAFDIVLLDEITLTVQARVLLEGVGSVRVLPGVDQDELPSSVANADALIFQLSQLRLSADVMDAAPALKVIGRVGIGVDQIDIAAAMARDITVVNAAGAQADAVADHAMALMLAVARNIVAGHLAVMAAKWKSPQHFLGHSLTGKALGIVGFGAVGQMLAARAAGFGMSILAFDPYLPNDRIVASGATPSDLGTLLAGSDFVSIHVPLTSETEHLIGGNQFRSMRPGSYLINTSRGPVIDQQALIAALQMREIAGAGLDVFEHEPLSADSPLLNFEQVVLTPHIGGWTFEAQAKTQETVAADVARVLGGQPPQNPVTA